MKRNKIKSTLILSAVLLGICCLSAMAAGNGWKLVGKDWYYYDESGRKMTDYWVVDKIGTTPNLVAYYVNVDGKWVENAAYTGCEGQWEDTKFYRKDGTYPKDEYEYINGKWYFFDENGDRVTGLMRNKENGNFYYFYSDGVMAERTGWIELPDQTWIYVRGRVCVADAVTPDGYQMDSQAKWKKGSPQVIESDTLKITVPASWEGKYLYQVEEGEKGTITFYEKENYNASLSSTGLSSGRLMRILVGTEKDYQLSKEDIPTKLVGRKGDKVCFVEYPSDVQWDIEKKEQEEQYQALSSNIDLVISGVYIK